jgi:hypothetical protein
MAAARIVLGMAGGFCAAYDTVTSVDARNVSNIVFMGRVDARAVEKFQCWN